MRDTFIFEWSRIEGPLRERRVPRTVYDRARVTTTVYVDRRELRDRFLKAARVQTVFSFWPTDGTVGRATSAIAQCRHRRREQYDIPSDPSPEETRSRMRRYIRTSTCCVTSCVYNNTHTVGRTMRSVPLGRLVPLGNNGTTSECTGRRPPSGRTIRFRRRRSTVNGFRTATGKIVI